MKRIYKEYSYGKELVGYDYKGIIIEIEEEFLGGLYGNTKKWYHINLNGKPLCFGLLKECKEYIDKEVD